MAKNKPAAAKPAGTPAVHPEIRPGQSIELLKELHILTRDGQLNQDSRRKLKQVYHLYQFIEPLLAEVLAETGDLSLADHGAGKSYLGFILYDLFLKDKPAGTIHGIETRAELVQRSRELAERLGFPRMHFLDVSVEESTHSGQLPERIDVVTALHACNTATDDAIRRGINLGARLIVVAPCCHKELRPQLGQPEPFAPVLRHGLMEERMAEWVTDGLRALFLEWAGYRTKVMEFVGSEHTPKNLMIAAVREREPFVDEAARKRIEDLKSFFGVRQHALDSLLNESGHA